MQIFEWMNSIKSNTWSEELTIIFHVLTMLNLFMIVFSSYLMSSNPLLNNLTLNTCHHLHYAVNRTQWIIRKTVVFVAVSCFEYIFIIIYLYILLYIILYIPITYFYNYILFSCFKYFVCFHHNWDLVACFHHIYSFSKIFVAIKI